MVDSRLPSRWLHDPRMDGLSDTSWRIFTCGLMLSNEQQSDGYIAPGQLRWLHPVAAEASAVQELVLAGLWGVDGIGYRVTSWDETQTTAAQLSDKRRKSRESSQKARDVARKRRTSGTATHVIDHVIGHHQGEDRKGQARTREVEEETARLTWPTVAIPVSCVVCAEPIDPGTPNALCSRQDGAHRERRQIAA
ncbi:hypothetical protein DEI93_12345 [Curtobacterium sp. MCBD17_035]|uniref:hypothetical protein n=1 Tax=Curtobacterium sp. MCBD17_035 TaxID=2175673 RepID=UPI0011B6AB9F|nr:hypothetical protein [Curtobacterium sp. MCBD17_035]WIB66747.1 hypothetical protein DEI93_12345 [Curtobacterium sp. MCBD17_035]